MQRRSPTPTSKVRRRRRPAHATCRGLLCIERGASEVLGPKCIACGPITQPCPRSDAIPDIGWCQCRQQRVLWYHIATSVNFLDMHLTRTATAALTLPRRLNGGVRSPPLRRQRPVDGCCCIVDVKPPSCRNAIFHAELPWFIHFPWSRSLLSCSTDRNELSP